MADEINIIVKATDSFSGVFGDLGNIMTGIKSTIDLVSGAFNAAADFVGQFVDSASESQQALVGLETVLKSTGGTAGLTIDQLSGLATNLQSVSMFSDEAAMSAEAMLLRYENITSDIFPQALKLTADLASSLGIDLTTAARQVGMALDDPTAGIGRLNTQFRIFDDSQMKVIKDMAEAGDVAGAQALIMDGLRQKVGGAAEAFGQTFAGQMEIARNKMDDIKEMIGGALLPKLTDLLNWFTDFVSSPDVQKFSQTLTTALATGDFSNLDTFIANFFSSLKTSIDVWAAGPGPQEVTDKIVSFIDSIGTGEGTDIKMLGAAGRLLDAIGRAVEKIDWSTIGWKFDAAISRVISAQDWSASGDAFGDAIEKFFTDGFNTGTENAANNIGSASVIALQNAFRDFFVGAIGGEQAAAYWSSAWENLLDKAKIVFNFGWDDIGKAIVDGIISGVQWAWGNFKDLFSFGFDDVINFVKDLLGIHSRSTVFFEISTNIVQGLIDGWNGLFASFKAAVSKGINEILQLFAPILSLFGVDVPTIGITTGGTSGNFSGFGSTSTGATSTGSKYVNNYFYGPVYFASDTQTANYDCPSPNPFMTAGSGSLVPHAL